MSVVDCKPMKTHLDRVSAGFHVEVGQIEQTGEWVLRAWTDSYHAKVPILPEQRLEAYLHPCVFIPDADKFFRELKEGELADNSLVEDPPVRMRHVENDLQEQGGVATMPDPMYCNGCGLSLHETEIGPYCSRCGTDGA